MSFDTIQATEGHNTKWAQAEHSPAHVFDAAEILSVQNHAVKIRIPGTTGFGTGFFVTSDQPSSCEVATLSHVTDGRSHITIFTLDGQTADAVLEKVDWKHQIAVYKAQDVARAPAVCKEAKISRQAPSQSENLVGIGMEPGLPPVATPFEVTALGFVARRDTANLPIPDEDMARNLLVLGGPGKHGYSGGPIYNANQEVVALEAGAGPDPNTSVAEFAVYLQDVLDEIKTDHEKTTKAQQENKP
jgi:S1-C subfamily serine protease